MTDKQYMNFTRKLYGRRLHTMWLILFAVSAAGAVICPIFIMLESMFMWIYDVLLKNYYPIEADYAPEKQKESALPDNRPQKRTLVSQLPISRQLLMKAIYRERFPELIISAVCGIALGIRIGFIGIDFNAGTVLFAFVFLALSIISRSESYAYAGARFAGFDILNCDFPSLLWSNISILCTMSAVTKYNPDNPVHTNIGVGIALIVIMIITLLGSMGSHKKAIRKSEGTAYNGEAIHSGGKK